MGKFGSLIQSSQNSTGNSSNNLLGNNLINNNYFKSNLINDQLLGDNLLGKGVGAAQSSATEQTAKGQADPTTEKDSGHGYYYTADGTFIAKVGDSDNVRVIYNDYSELGKKYARYAEDTYGTARIEDYKWNIKEANKYSKSIGITNAELNVRAFLTLIKHAERHHETLFNDYKVGVDLKDVKDKKTGKITKQQVYGRSQDENGPFGAYQLMPSTFRLFLDAETTTEPENQDKAAFQILKRTKKGTAYALIISDAISKPATMQETIQKASDILGSPTKPGKKDMQWPSLPGQSQEGVSIDEAVRIFKKALSQELYGQSNIATPKGKLL